MEFYPLVEKGEKVPLGGGRPFILPVGTMYARNITPDEQTGIGKLKDGEIARALRYGVSHDGRALFDFMPFQNLSDDDLTAVISFLRVCEPIKNKVPEHQLNLMGEVVKAFLIRPVGPRETPPKTVAADTTAEYGKYLAWNVSNCRGCHTNRSLFTGAYTGIDFAGGLKIPTDTNSAVLLCPPNLTPVKTSIISEWDFATFRNRFRQGKFIPESMMPWGPFSRMNDDELKAIFKFLKSLQPVENETGPYKQTAG